MVEDSEEVDVDVTLVFDDADGDTLTYTYSSSNTALVNVTNDDSSVTTLSFVRDASGAATITVTASDGNGGTDASTTFDVVVTAQNDAPTVAAVISDVIVNEDASDTVIDVSSTFADVDGVITGIAAISSDDTLVTATVDGTTLTLSFQPDASGTATVTVIGTDDGGLAVGSIFDVTVNAVNDDPVIADDAGGTLSVTTNEDTPVNGQVFASDVDAGDTLTFSKTDGANGVVTIDVVTGEFVYTPNENFNGADSFMVTVTDDGTGTLTDITTVNVTVNSVNDEPVAVENDYTTAEQTPISGNVITDDTGSGVDNDPSDSPTNALNAVLASDVNHGTVTLNDDGSFTYTPISGFVGQDSFSYQVIDDGGIVNGGDATGTVATVTITVTSSNDAPVVSNPIPDVSAEEDDADLVLDLSQAFQDPDGDALTLSAASGDTSLVDVVINGTNLTLNFQPDASGVTTVTVTAQDPNSATITDTFTVSVDSVNDAPIVANPIADVMTTQNAGQITIDLSNVFLDVENGTTLGLIAISSDDTAVIATVVGTDLILGVQPDGDTNATITVIGSDADGIVTGDVFDVFVNHTPVLATIGNQIVVEQTELTFTASATDSDVPADTLTFSLVNGPAGAVIDPFSGVFSWTPSEAQGTGNFTFDVVVTDDGTGSLSDSETITVTVTEVNVAPVLGSVGDRSVAEGSELTFTVTASDSDIPANNLTFSLSGAPMGATIDPSSGLFSFTPTEAQGPGSFTFDVVVTDSGTGNLTDSETITVTVNETTAGENAAPILGSIGDRGINEGSELSFTATASDSDLPANNLTFSLTGAAAGATIDPSTGLFSFTPTESQGPGTFTFDVVVTDDGPGNLSDSETITVTVAELNSAPVLGSIGDRTVDELTELTFTATANDADVPANSLTFSLIGAPAGATIDPSTGLFQFTPTEAQGPGTFTFDVAVTDDGTGTLSDSETITVTVNETTAGENAAPVLGSIGNQNIDENSELSFTATASDADLPANMLTFSLTGAPAGATIDPSSGLFSFTPTEAQGPGTFTFDVVVTDDGPGNLSDSETITVTVNEVNSAPVLGSIGDRTVNELTELSFTATASDSDLPANTLTFGLSGAPAGATIDPSSGLFRFIPTEAQGPGTFTFDVVVTDDGTGTLSDSETITVTVNETNEIPVLGSIADQTIGAGAGTVDLTVASASTVPGPITLTASGVPAFATFVDNGNGTGQFTFAPDSSDISSSTVTVTATNSNGSVSESFDLAVVAPTTTTAQTPIHRINAGGGVTGGFSADQFSNTGATFGTGASINTSAVPAGNPASLFQSGRYDNAGGSELSYNLPAAAGDYQVNLYFAEIYGPTSSAGARVFDVSIEGNLVLDNFDIFSEAGGANRAIVRSFNVTSDGTINVAFGHVVENPLVMGIEVIRLDQVANEGPALTNVGPQQVPENGSLSIQINAADGESDAITLQSSSLPSFVTFVDQGNGTGTLTANPTAADVGSYPISVQAQAGDQPLTDETAFILTVTDVNTAPVLTVIGDQAVDELTELTFTASASDSDDPADVLTFSLSGAPAGATIDTSSGLFSFTPTEAQGPGTFTFDVVVTDSGTGNLTDSETITVTVNETTAGDNTSPTLGSIGDRSVAEGSELSFTATASDSDLPANMLTFSLIGAPAGATIDPFSGLFSFTPTEAQGPGTFTFDVIVTDDGDGTLSDSETITVTVNEVNSAPVLGSIGDRTVNELTELSFTAAASDSDLPANMLTFSLSSAPTGATIDPSSGVFSWIPTEAQGPGTFTFDVAVTDDGPGTLSDSETITVTVNETSEIPVLGSIADQTIGAGAGTVDLTVASASADPGPINLTASGVPAFATFVDNGDGTGSFTFAPDSSDISSSTVTVTATNSNGSVSESFDLAAVAPTTTAAQTPVHRINAGGGATGGFSGDQFSTTGSTFSTGAAINTGQAPGTPTSLFQSGRYDTAGGSELSYNLPAAAGEYQVNLYFAEIYGPTSSVGARVFDVSIEGNLVLDNFDIFSEAGGANRGIVRSFNVTSDGTINVDFGRVTENPFISGIEVIRLDQVANEGLVLTNVGPQQVDENGSLTIQINASDNESDAITLQSSSLPSFVTFVDQGNGTGTLTANPTAADVGSYPISLQAQAGDQPLTDETAFILAVDDVFSDVSGMMGATNGG